MSKKIEMRLLAEAFDALVNDNNVAKASRLMKRHIDLVAQNQYQLLESADEEFEVTDMGDDFNNEVAAEAGSDEDRKFEEIQIAIDELEDKFPAEMTEEVEAKFDELRNIVDEMKLGGEDAEVSADDATIIIEDLKGEFELAGEVADDVNELFDEISTKIAGDVDVADDDSEFEAEVADEDFGADEVEPEEVSEALEDTEVEVDVEDETPAEEEVEDETPAEEEVEEEQEDEIYDIKSDVEELLAKIEELEASEKEEVNESWEKIADPRKKASTEGEGVQKKSVMNKKAPEAKLVKKSQILAGGASSEGKSADVKVKVNHIENDGTMKKVEKPANKAADAKSVLGN